MAGMTLHSPAFAENEMIPAEHAKEHDNLSPPLVWSNVPDSAVELALVCEDPDAPSGLFLHWLVTGIDPRSTGVDRGEAPGGNPHINGYGESGWGGPQPPRGHGAHRYVFHLFALRDALDLPQRPGTADDVHRALAGKVIDSGSTVGRYERP